jgi:hypothetical protein
MPGSANPYIAGSPVTGEEMFFGRKDVFDFVKQALTGQHRDHVLVLYGQRRTGKTSVLYQMHRHLESRYLCIFIDLHGLALNDLDGFIWELANHISRSLKRNYQILVPLQERSDFLTDPRGNFEVTFLDEIWSAVGDRHILLMLDEAVRLEEQVSAGKLEPEIFEYLRHLMQHHPRLNFLFSLGSGLEEMEKEYAFLFNVALYKKISFLDRQSAVELITQPVEGLYQFGSGAVERIIQITSAHPYFIQLICHSLFNYCQNQSLTTVGVEDVDAVLDETVERGLAVLKHVWEESTPVEKATLAGMGAAIGQNGVSASSNQIGEMWEKQGMAIPAGELARAIKSLISRDVIAGEAQYEFTVDLQRLWVQKYRRLEWVREEIQPAAGGWAREEPQPKPFLERAWGRRRRFVLPVLGLMVAFFACCALIYNWIFGIPTFGPAVGIIQPSQLATTPTTLEETPGASSEMTVEPSGGIVPGGAAALVSDLETLGGYVWAATDGGLVRWSLQGDAFLIHGNQIGLPDDCINTITDDPQDNLWLGCGGVAWIQPEGERVMTLGYFNRDDGLDMGVVNALSVDRQGRIWAGGGPNPGGEPPLNYFDGESHPDGLSWQSDAALNQALGDLGKELEVSSLLSSQDGSLWIGLEAGDVLRWDGESLDIFPLEAPDVQIDSEGDLRVRNMLEDQDGGLWAAAGLKGLFRFDEAVLSWSRVDIDGIEGAVRSVAQTSDSILWAGVDEVVAVSGDRGDTWTVVGEGLGHVGSLVEDSLGQVWAGSYGTGVSMYQSQSWRVLQH